MRMHLFSLIVGLALSGASAPAFAANYVRMTADTPVCTDQDLSRWNYIVNNTLGVFGTDPEGYYIGHYPAERYANMNNWHPLDAYKQTLTGVIDNFKVYDGLGDEMDWNTFVIPNASHQFLINDALPYKGSSGIWCFEGEWWTCAGNQPCIEAEITPDENFYENPWFPKSTGISVLKGQQVCFYGPWVRECVHGNRPEIHPSELIWWRENWQGNYLYWLMVLHDDSNRFDDRSEFDLEGDVPAQWRPWATAPRTGLFQFAFLANPNGPALEYVIGESFSRNVITPNDANLRADADDGAEHALEYNGRVVVKVTEMQAVNENIGVTFTNVCRRADGMLQGYVTLKTKISRDNGGNEGYHVIFVLATPAPRALPPDRPLATLRAARPAPRLRMDRTSLRFENGALVGNLRVDFGGEAGATRVTGAQRIEPGATIDPGRRVDPGVVLPPAERIERRVPGEVLRRDLPILAQPDGTSALVQNVSLIKPGTIELQLADGRTTQVPWPGMSVAPQVSAVAISNARNDAAAWPAMRAAVKGREAAPPPVALQHVPQWQIDIEPQYALLKNGQPSLEEDSPASEELNAVLRGRDAGRMRTVFGSEPPAFPVTWSFKATNLTTGAEVPVSVGRNQPGAVRVDVQAGKVPDGRLRVTFPNGSEAVYELTATATMQDPYGTGSQVRYQASSHVLTGDTPASLVQGALPTVAALAGRAAEMVTYASLQPLPYDDWRITHVSYRRARMTHLFAMDAAADNLITAEELTRLVDAARLFVPLRPVEGIRPPVIGPPVFR